MSGHDKAPTQAKGEVDRKNELTLKLKNVRTAIFVILMVPLFTWIVATRLFSSAESGHPKLVIGLTIFSLVSFLVICVALIVFYIVQFVLEKRGVIYAEPASVAKLVVSLVLIALLGTLMFGYYWYYT
jgi:hypothetical protein